MARARVKKATAASKTAADKTAENGNGNGASAGTTPLKLAAIKRSVVHVRIIGRSPIIQHNWGKKAAEMMRLKHAGKKTKSREVRNPEEEMKEAMYVTEDGRPGIKAMALKTAIINAAHKDIGVEKTLVKKALFIICEDANGVIEMEADDPIMREDPVRVGQGQADLRYRPEFRNWSVETQWEVDTELLQVEDLVNLMDRAGFGVGIHEWRPERGGEFGRFEVDRVTPVHAEVLPEKKYIKK